MSMQSPTDAESFYKFLGHTLNHGERETPPEALLRKWREQRERGGLTGLSGHRRGPKVDANAVELARLQRENKRLQEKLERAELIIDVQKKVARLLGIPLTDNRLSEDS